MPDAAPAAVTAQRFSQVGQRHVLQAHGLADRAGKRSVAHRPGDVHKGAGTVVIGMPSNSVTSPSSSEL